MQTKCLHPFGDNPTKYDKEKLGDFLTFILHYPLDVETPEVEVSSNYINDNNNYCDLFKDKKLICFSGGIDSTGALLNSVYKGEKPVALWTDYGQPYRIPEKECVEKICNKLDIPLIEATLDISDLIEVGGEKFGHVFPARNLLISAIALCFKPSSIELAGLCDELIVPDKSLRMYKEFGKIFEIPLSSPFVDMTKTEVLCLWKKRWNKYLDAKETVSCYSDNGNCQNCSSCAKREVAFIASNYSSEFPIVFNNQHELIEGHWFDRIDIFEYQRRTDLLIALNKTYDLLTNKLQELVSVNSKKYSDEINKRLEELGRIE